MENQPVSIIESRAEAYRRQLGMSQQSEKRTPTMFLVFVFSILVIIGTVVVMVFLSTRQPDNEVEPAPLEESHFEERREEVLNETLAALIRNNMQASYVSETDQTAYFDATPAEIVNLFQLNTDNLDLSSAFSVPAMNSNIVNYYLDQSGTIVIIYDKADYTVVFAGRPYDEAYQVFSTSAYSVNHDIFAEYTSKYSLLEPLSADAKFYVLQKKGSS